MVGFFFGFVSKPGSKLSSSESVSSSGSDCGGGLALITAKISINLLSLSAAAACHKEYQKSMGLSTENMQRSCDAINELERSIDHIHC